MKRRLAEHTRKANENRKQKELEEEIRQENE
jgi:hypothetical protein